MSPLWKEAYLTKKGRAVKLKCLKEMRVGLKTDAQPRIKKEMLTVYLRIPEKSQLESGKTLQMRKAFLDEE